MIKKMSFKFLHIFTFNPSFQVNKLLSYLIYFATVVFYGIPYKINIFIGACVYLPVLGFDVSGFVLALIFIKSPTLKKYT